MNRLEFGRAASVAEARDLVAEKPGSLLLCSPDACQPGRTCYQA